MLLFNKFLFLSKKQLRSKIKNLLIHMSDGTDSISGAEIDRAVKRFCSLV